MRSVVMGIGPPIAFEAFSRAGYCSWAAGTLPRTTARRARPTLAAWTNMGLATGDESTVSAAASASSNRFLSPVIRADQGISIGEIFAAGDVRAGSTKQVASAIGEGATAALMIRQFLAKTEGSRGYRGD